MSKNPKDKKTLKNLIWVSATLILVSFFLFYSSSLHFINANKFANQDNRYCDGNTACIEMNLKSAIADRNDGNNLRAWGYVSIIGGIIILSWVIKLCR